MAFWNAEECEKTYIRHAAAQVLERHDSVNAWIGFATAKQCDRAAENGDFRPSQSELGSVRAKALRGVDASKPTSNIWNYNQGIDVAGVVGSTVCLSLANNRSQVLALLRPIVECRVSDASLPFKTLAVHSLRRHLGSIPKRRSRSRTVRAMNDPEHANEEKGPLCDVLAWALLSRAPESRFGMLTPMILSYLIDISLLEVTTELPNAWSHPLSPRSIIVEHNGRDGVLGHYTSVVRSTWSAGKR